MKKHFLKTILLTIFMNMVGLHTYADILYPLLNGVYYALDDPTRTAQVVGIEDGGMGIVVYIGQYVNHDEKSYKITGIASSAFKNRTKLISITINNEYITNIKESTFYGCTGLTSITIPNSVTSIGEDAFRGCTGLTSIVIPNNITSLGWGAFKDCSNLKKVEINSNAIVSKNYANFTTQGPSYNDKSLCNIFGEQVEEYVLGDAITSIGKFAFGRCSELKSIIIPNSVTDINWHAFYGCRNLTSVSLPNSITKILSFAFSHCTGLTSISIPNSVTMIQTYAFDGCTGLTSISFPNSVTRICEYAFQNCTGLTSVFIPCSVTKMEEKAFSGCNKIAKVEINSDSIVSKGPSFSKMFGNQVKEYVLGEGITSIASSKFADCTGLTSVSIPNGVTGIGYNAFQNCSSLTSISIPNSVTSIGRYAFNNCSSLTSISIPNGITSIGECTFSRCSKLTSIYIPNSVAFFGRSAFSGCSMLTAVHIMDLESWCKVQFEELINDNPLYYAHHLYLNDEEIKDLVIPDNVTSISDYAFCNCTDFVSISIPNSVTTVGKSAFDGCSGITSVTLSCENVNQWFDSSKQKITKINIDEGVKTINENAFKDCVNVETIDISSTVTTIGQRAFSGSTKLTDVTCKAITVPETDRGAFENSYTEYVTLHVPTASISDYKKTNPWSGFKEIVALKQDLPDDAEKCATPTITYQNGKLSFASETEGVEFNYVITDNDIKAGANAEVQLDATYHISVYAIKEGYKDSETATATLCWIDANPTTEGITQGIASVSANAVLIRSNNGILSITGAPEGTSINVYDMSGKAMGSAKASAETTNVATSLHRGDVGIVKIGEKSVKIMVK